MQHPDSSQDVLKSVAAIAETGGIAESCFAVVFQSPTLENKLAMPPVRLPSQL